jgi:multicomponent Na+:H+ antiporter subunit E
MNGALDSSRGMVRTALVRGLGYFGFWLILFGFGLADLVVGVFATAIATWVSLRLLPSGKWRLRPGPLARFSLRFLRQSIAAGLDVAWRAFDPRLPLGPGFLTYRPHLEPGFARSAFCTETSLVPGTLPSGFDENGALIIHCLDVNQPIVAQLTEEETLFAGALGVRVTDG